MEKEPTVPQSIFQYKPPFMSFPRRKGIFIINQITMKKTTWYYILAVIALLIAIIVGVNANSDDATDASTDVSENMDTIDVTTTIQVDEQITEYPQTVNESTTALEALELLATQGEIDVQTTKYDFGIIVDSIDAIGDDTSDNKYWIYYINDTVADVGASEYVLMQNDTIRWNYETSI